MLSFQWTIESVRDICVIIASTMVFLYYVFKGFIGEIWDKRAKEKEEKFKHERHMESAKLTRTREENKHLTQTQTLAMSTQTSLMMKDLLVNAESRDKKGLSAIFDDLGKEKTFEVIQQVLQNIDANFEIIKKILTDEQNNFVRQNYEDRRVMIAATDDSQLNEQLHNEAPNTFN